MLAFAALTNTVHCDTQCRPGEKCGRVRLEIFSFCSDFKYVSPKSHHRHHVTVRL